VSQTLVRQGGFWSALLARDSRLRRALETALLSLLALLLVGLALRPLHSRAWEPVRATMPETRAEDLEATVGQGVLLATLGGFRALAADMVFLEMSTAWQADEREQVEALLKLATTIDPRPLFFWLEGARILAYDTWHWQVRERGGYTQVPPEVRERFSREQARRALAMLEEALHFHSDEPRIYAEMAAIHLNRLQDRRTAAELYGAAWKLGGDYVHGRLHALLLSETGQLRAAYDFLRQWYPTLPEDTPGAMKPLVRERIIELEETLNIPAEERIGRY